MKNPGSVQSHTDTHPVFSLLLCCCFFCPALGFVFQEELRGKGLEEFNQKDRKEKQEKRQFGLDQ